MYDDIRLEKLKFENQTTLEKQQSSLRKSQLKETWLTVIENQKSYKDYMLESKEIEEVS